MVFSTAAFPLIATSKILKATLKFGTGSCCGLGSQIGSRTNENKSEVRLLGMIIQYFSHNLGTCHAKQSVVSALIEICNDSRCSVSNLTDLNYCRQDSLIRSPNRRRLSLTLMPQYRFPPLDTLLRFGPNALYTQHRNRLQAPFCDFLNLTYWINYSVSPQSTL